VAHLFFSKTISARLNQSAATRRRGGITFFSATRASIASQSMKQLSLLITASIRAQMREAKNHLYAWLILTPMVLSITYLSASRLAENVSLALVSFSQVWLIGALFCLSLMGFTL